MLHVSDAMVAGAVKSYFAVADYFVDGHNPVGIWGGELAKQLGLHGVVQKEHMDRLAEGYHPFTGEDLVQNRLENRRSANDITISAPKPVTLLYMRTKDERILDAFVRSCDDVMAVMEQDAAARVRKGGADYDRLTRNWAYSGHVHFEARPDKESQLSAPQLHRHHVVYNLTRDPVENEIKALQIGIAKGNADLYMPMFHNILARRMRDLGYGVERTGKVGFGIKGISRDLVERFSPRRLTIQGEREKLEKLRSDPEERKKLADRLGIKDERHLDALLAKRAEVFSAEIGKLTRKHKQKELTHEQLARYWDAMLTDRDKTDLDNAKGRKGWDTTDEKAAAYAIEHLFDRVSVIEKDAEKKLLIEALRYGVGSVTVERLRDEFRRQGVLYVNGEATTRKNLKEEQVVTEFTREGMGTLRPAAKAYTPAPGLDLTDEQENAVRSLLTSPHAVNMVDAGQGTGKTTMMQEYGRALTENGVKTTWLGTTHTAVDELKARNLPAMTVAAFLRSDKEKGKAAGSRIILDEASMLSHRDNVDLFRYAQGHGNRIDLIGDSKQYKTPSAGHPMKLLVEFGGVKPITMTKTMRQKGKLKEAMEAIRDDRELKAHDKLAELGMVHELPLDHLAQKAAELYLKWTKPGESIPCVSPTHAQAAEISAKIREGLRARGELKGEDHVVRRLVNLGWSGAQLKDAKENGAEGVTLLRYGAYQEATLPLAVGDRVRTTMAGATKDGHRVNNGQRYTIKGFTEDKDPILSNGWVIDKNWGGLNQDYVSTGQGSQGKTAKSGIVVYGTPSLVATRHEGFYVPVSRVRQEVAVLTDSNEALRDAIQRRESKKLATELVGPKKAKRKGRRKFMERVRDFYDRLKERTAGAMREDKQRERGHDLER
jgi:conjugative relaxase-like TrwC/TraI family protein